MDAYDIRDGITCEGGMWNQREETGELVLNERWC